MWKGTSHGGSLGLSNRDKAIAKLASVKVANMNGTYVQPSQVEPATQTRSDRPTFTTVAEHYKPDPEGPSKLPQAQRPTKAISRFWRRSQFHRASHSSGARV